MNKHSPDPRINDLIAVYEAAKKRLDEIVRNTQGEYTRARALAAQRDIDQIIEGLNEYQGAWTVHVLPDIYLDQRMADVDVIESHIGDFRMDKLNFGQLDQRRVAIAVDAMKGDLEKATGSMKQFYDGWLMRSGFVAGETPELPPSVGVTQTKIDRELTRVIAEGQAAGESRRQTSAVLEDVLKRELEEGGKVQIRCVDGKIREYEPKQYAELVARTRTREIATESTKATMAAANEAYGIRLLVQVAPNATACELCLPIQGNIYSLDPNDKEYPSVDEIDIPVHPNCTDVLTPYIELTAEEKALVREAA